MSSLRESLQMCADEPADGTTTAVHVAPTVVYVAKMVCAAGVSGAHVDDEFIAFARVFCGR